MAAELATKEVNGTMHVMCPYCSKNYALEDDKGVKTDLPSACRRCGSPMDASKAKAFADKRAEIENNPAVTELGERFRGRKAKVTA